MAARQFTLINPKHTYTHTHRGIHATHLPHNNNRNALARAGERENRNLRTANTAMICRRQYSTVCAAAQPLRSIRRLGNASTGGCHATALAGECEVRNARCERHSRHHPPSRRNVSRRCFRQPSHTEQNRTHGIFRLQPPRATELPTERDSRRAQEWPQQLRSTKRAQRQRERSCLALLSCFTVPCALLCACCLARTQQLHSFPPNFNHLPDCSHTGSAARALSLSFAGRQKQVAGACGFSSSRNCVLLSGILI